MFVSHTPKSKTLTSFFLEKLVSWLWREKLAAGISTGRWKTVTQQYQKISDHLNKKTITSRVLLKKNCNQSGFFENEVLAKPFDFLNTWEVLKDLKWDGNRKEVGMSSPFLKWEGSG